MIECPDCRRDLRMERFHGQHRLICRACGWVRWMKPAQFSASEDEGGEVRKQMARSTASARNREIVRRVLAGEQQVRVARDYGITRQRVGQIVARWRDEAA